jgi:hypothetical protein
MTTTSKLIIFIFTFLALAANAHAQSPGEQLKQMVEQLQSSPNDNPLRERIIKLAATLKPAPAIPEEAGKRSVRGEYALKDAKSPQDFEGAAEEFLAASNLAPWISDYYFNLGVVREKQEKLTDAKSAFSWYVLAAPNAADTAEVKKKIIGLEFLIEKKEKAAKAENDKEARLAMANQALSTLRRGYTHGWCEVNGRTRCNEAETKGSNWGKVFYAYGRPRIESFTFPGDGTVVVPMYFALQNDKLVGTPYGTTDREIAWVCHWNGQVAPAYFERYVNNGGFKFSCDRAFGTYDPNRTYTYETFQVN